MFKQLSSLAFNAVGASLIFYGIILIWLNDTFGEAAVIAGLSTPILLVLLIFVGRLWIKNREIRAKEAAKVTETRPRYTDEDARQIQHVR